VPPPSPSEPPACSLSSSNSAPDALLPYNRPFPLILTSPAPATRHRHRSFFGLTALGQGNVFEHAKATKLQRLTSTPVQTFVDTFAEMSLERTNPGLAEEIRVDGKMFMVGTENCRILSERSFCALGFRG